MAHPAVFTEESKIRDKGNYQQLDRSVRWMTMPWPSPRGAGRASAINGPRAAGYEGDAFPGTQRPGRAGQYEA